MKIREKITHEHIEYMIGSVASGKLYYKKYSSTKEFLESSRLFREWQANSLKLVGRVNVNKMSSKALSNSELAFF
jgi:hypothetical protein